MIDRVRLVGYVLGMSLMFLMLCIFEYLKLI